MAHRPQPSFTPAAGAPAGPAAPADRGGSPAPRRVLYLVFTLSGLTGLVYEATWTRYLQLFLGHAAYAQVLVLALYMGGMGGGRAAGGPPEPRIRVAPLVGLRGIEAGLGIAALVSTRFRWRDLERLRIAAPERRRIPDRAGAALAARAAALILPQSILLGMTFPLMSVAVLRLGCREGRPRVRDAVFREQRGGGGRRAARGLLADRSVGLQATMTVAGVGNLWSPASRWWSRGAARGRAGAIRPPAVGGIGAWLLAFAFLTATASFLYEIAWLRMLALVQGASTHAFETMLSAFILGIALGGSWIRGRIERLRSPLAALAARADADGACRDRDAAGLPLQRSMSMQTRWSDCRAPSSVTPATTSVGYLISAASWCRPRSSPG